MRTIWAASTLMSRLPLGAAHGLVDHDRLFGMLKRDPSCLRRVKRTPSRRITRR